MDFKEKLEKANACSDAVDWVGENSLKEAWDTCHRGDWILWYVSKNRDELGLADMRLITKAKALCAKTVIHLMNDERSINAIEMALKFGNGLATKKELDKPYKEAYKAYEAYEDYAVSASTASAATAYKVYAAAAYAAYSAAAYFLFYDATAADYAAAAASAFAASASDSANDKEENLLQSADICRTVFKDINLK